MAGTTSLFTKARLSKFSPRSGTDRVLWLGSSGPWVSHCQATTATNITLKGYLHQIWVPSISRAKAGRRWKLLKTPSDSRGWDSAHSRDLLGSHYECFAEFELNLFHFFLAALYSTTISRISNTCDFFVNGTGFDWQSGSCKLFSASMSSLSRPMPTSASDRGIPSSRIIASRTSPKSAVAESPKRSRNTSVTTGS